MNKKGEGTGIGMIISVVVLIIILTFYFIFFTIMPEKEMNVKLKDYVPSEADLDFINFVKLNSDLIVKSVNTNNFEELEKEFLKLYHLGDCINLQINEKILRKGGCLFEETYATKEESPRQASFNKDVLAERNQITTKIPDYNNNKINIILKIKNE